MNIIKETFATQAKLLKALAPHKRRLELVAAAETGCPTKARALATYVMAESAQRRGLTDLKKNPARKLLSDMTATLQRLRKTGAMA